jgi:hypothetical protein
MALAIWVTVVRIVVFQSGSPWAKTVENLGNSMHSSHYSEPIGAQKWSRSPS